MALVIAGIAVAVAGLVMMAVAGHARWLCESAGPMIARAKDEPDPEMAERLLDRAQERIDRADRLLHPWRMLRLARQRAR